MIYSFSSYDIEQQVRSFMQQLGIAPARNTQLILDGQLHRYSTDDDRGSETSGAYCIYTDGLPAGFVMDWRKGVKENWCFDTGSCNNEQKAYFNSEEFRRKQELIQQQREKRRKELYAVAVSSARSTWDKLSTPDEDFSYFQKRYIQLRTAL